MTLEESMRMYNQLSDKLNQEMFFTNKINDIISSMGGWDSYRNLLDSVNASSRVYNQLSSQLDMINKSFQLSREENLFLTAKADLDVILSSTTTFVQSVDLDALSRCLEKIETSADESLTKDDVETLNIDEIAEEWITACYPNSKSTIKTEISKFKKLSLHEKILFFIAVITFWVDIVKPLALNIAETGIEIIPVIETKISEQIDSIQSYTNESKPHNNSGQQQSN